MLSRVHVCAVQDDSDEDFKKPAPRKPPAVKPSKPSANVPAKRKSNYKREVRTAPCTAAASEAMMHTGQNTEPIQRLQEISFVNKKDIQPP